ncbi:hypothetical protein J6524_04935 [Bradyrhizobium sp. WSM 1738]|uniref:hypothetical protein n=1 Tax=Bradyrhizobium hereditatis TaxID=2821405 RepID=UPI001CE2C1A3|nr:hypothetical protein [Bradyrhizobium hereditatis]MCA6114274.1 hypothetical protein [Bradyrhizobium hereditatis]
MATDAQTYFVNLYRPLMGACGSVYTSRELADQMAGRDRLACVEVKVGVGLGATLFNQQRAAGEQ